MHEPIFQYLLRYRVIIIVLMHMVFAAGSIFLSFLFRFDFTLGGEEYARYCFYTMPINAVIFLIFSGTFNLFQGIWRYVSVDDLRDIIKASALTGLVFMFVIIFSGRLSGYPRSIYVLNFALLIALNGGTRFGIRVFRESFVPMSEDARNVLIVGAGNAGNEIAKSLKSSKNKHYVPVGFIDKDANTHGKRIQGIKVLGNVDFMRGFIKKYRVHEVFIAIPEATNKLVKEIVDASRIPDWEVKFKITPSVLDIMSGKYALNNIREVSINDLLSRPNIKLDDKNVRKQIAAKTVLITGAGGSIGSEISYQVAAYSPSRMILLDAGEENAYTIDLELKRRHPSIAIHTIVGSILDSSVVDMIMKEYQPDFVYHAAAYKHVHLMEWNPIACFKNNVLGTAMLASSAEKNGVKQFVMISTDKAVNPRGIMGISKRLAERVVLERNPSKTLFNVVRFGNVLGSSGSVIPLFQRQIRDGGPVTVTSPETRRFFMSIPEAVQLVLQASTLQESNAIFMLEMGEPVKIVDLARNLIELSGLKINEDIEIKFTGMRPGEKMEEELLTADENLDKTPFDKIRVQRNGKHSPEEMERFLHGLKSNVELGDIKSLYNSVTPLIPEMKGPTFDEMRENMFA